MVWLAVVDLGCGMSAGIGGSRWAVSSDTSLSYTHAGPFRVCLGGDAWCWWGSGFGVVDLVIHAMANALILANLGCGLAGAVHGRLQGGHN